MTRETERKKDEERGERGEGEGRRENVHHGFGSYKLRYGCNVPVVYYIAGSKPGQCNGSSTFPACLPVYTFPPARLTPVMHP